MCDVLAENNPVAVDPTAWADFKLRVRLSNPTFVLSFPFLEALMHFFWQGPQTKALAAATADTVLRKERESERPTDRREGEGDSERVVSCRHVVSCREVTRVRGQCRFLQFALVCW